ncbi:four helix bundle protein [Pontiellaceae bacterium B12227]|nr:four helix bundle protein [Pontiellaceae bacterium B12227]
MSDFKELEVWRKAIEVVTGIDRISSNFPDSEKFGLTNQIRRAAISIPSNIAEGGARHHANDFIHFLRIADGSAAEVETQLIIAGKLGFFDSEESRINELVIIRKMLAGLIKSLR